MTCPNRNRSHLFVGCGTAALALALALAPERAAAQAVNAGGTVTNGVAFIDDPAAGQTTVDVVTPTAVIDWQPFVDNNGDALTFLPAGNTLLFRSGQLPDFAVLNRILPTANNNIAVIDGNVLSRVNSAVGIPVPGGTVAFYSSTGLLIGSNATFDVGSLLLTTLDTTPASFDNFANGGFLTLQGAPGSTARVSISPGAQITALAENSFFAVVAADVEMFGTARINGSHAYVAGEVVNLQVSNGLFNISIPVGTAAAGEVVTLDGDVGGPSSMGAGDNHILYAVARASADPISMLFSGNLGFDPAQSAGIVNGEIILAANYNVSGRNVDSGAIDQGIDAVFRGASATSDVRADITLLDVNAGSSLLAIGTGQTIAGGNSTVDGNLLLVGRDVAAIDAIGDEIFEVSGDVLVDARDYGVVSSSLQSLDAINATGGTARILSSGGAFVTIGGSALVTADAFAGADDFNGIGGSAQGGLADITAAGGAITINGMASVRASGFGSNLDFIRTGAPARGGSARVTVQDDGTATFAQDLEILATGSGADSDQFSPSTVSDAFGGLALLGITGLGTVSIGGTATLDASATARGANAAAGALADAGEAAVTVNGAGTIMIDGGLDLAAFAIGGTNAGGVGGMALGGAARATTTNGGLLSVGGDFSARADARGGDGMSGGDGLGGIAGAGAITGTIMLAGDAFADASGFGGNGGIGPSIAFGGDGGDGRGGNAFFQATGAAGQLAVLTIGGDAQVLASGTGGDGGMSDGQAIPAGDGGDGFGGDFATPNQADPAFNSGAFLLAGGDYGTISVGGLSTVDASGTGGLGGADFGAMAGGRGGDGFGGLAQTGLALLGGPGTVGGGSATFGDLFVNADGRGGDGGVDAQIDRPTGQGGDGFGGNAIIGARSGDVVAGQVQLSALGVGAGGFDGGMGTGGNATVLGGQGGSLVAASIDLFALGLGGLGFSGNGGNGLGGSAAIEADGITVTINGGAQTDASGIGGGSLEGQGGDGTGGEAYIGVLTDIGGTVTVTGHASVIAAGQGGEAQGDLAGGNGSGGLAYLQAQGGSTITLGSALVHAFGQGGLAAQHEGGSGTGGRAELRSFGTGSQLIIQASAPSDLGGGPGEGALLNANGIGAVTTGGDGIGGDGRGGIIGVLARDGGSIALPVDPLADPNTVGAIQLAARGIGGGSEVDGGTGGMGIGGNGLIEADGAGSTIIMGDTIFTVMGEGGSSALSTSNVTGGNALGGNRRIRVLNGGEATLELIGGSASALGGNGSGTGNGGDATGGFNRVDLENGTLNIVGVLELLDQSTGGSGARGGDAFSNGEGGVISFAATDSTISFTPNGAGAAGIRLGGTRSGGAGEIAGGNATGETIAFALTNTALSGGFLRIDPLAMGGNATSLDGAGGAAFGSAIIVAVTDSIVNLAGEVLISANAEGGDGGADAGGTGGNATSGAINLSLTDATLAIAGNAGGPGALRLLSQARGGNGNTVGSAISALASLALGNSTVTADEVLVASLAFADRGRGALARAGGAVIDVVGTSQLTADRIALAANAVTGADGTSEAGTATLQIRIPANAPPTSPGSAATITAQLIELDANAFGADPSRSANAAGRLVVDVAEGNVNANSIFAAAFGDVIGASAAPSTFRAVGGSINVVDTLDISLLGDLLVETGDGGIIGGPRAAATITNVSILSGGVIEILGDNDAVAGLSGDVVSLSATDIDIAMGARVGADRVFITSLNQSATAILGGTADGMGFTLTGDELARISARELEIFLPRVARSNDPNTPDALVRDASLTGSVGSGFSAVRLFVGDDLPDGLLRFEGTLHFSNTAANDLLDIAARRIEIVTPGGIRLSDSDGAPSGTLRLSAGDIWIADAATISQLQADRNFAGRDAQLAVAASGSDDPLGYVRAGGVTLNVGNSLLVRNTGSAFAQGGILIGGGTLSIASSGGGQSGGGAILDVFAYGRRQTGPNAFVVGEAFFDEVNFNRASPASTLYLDAAAFNDCIINTGVCPQPPEPPPPPEPDVEAPPEINNPTVFSDPIVLGEPKPNGDGDDDRFGIDFPELPEAPLITEEPLLDDPVTSGGDATVYGAAPAAGGQ